MPEAIPINPAPKALETFLNLLRHLNPSENERNLELLGEALPELKESLRALVDIPAKIIVATEANNREFLTCELTKNSCADCYRYNISFILILCIHRLQMSLG